MEPAEVGEEAGADIKKGQKHFLRGINLSTGGKLTGLN